MQKPQIKRTKIFGEYEIEKDSDGLLKFSRTRILQNEGKKGLEF